MDDHKFDDIIKGKMNDYEAPGFDPSALSALHRQMDSLTVWPWYSRYRTELLLGSGLMLCTLIVLWSQWYYNNRETLALEKNSVLLSVQQSQIEQLQHEIEVLRSLPPDTIRIIEIKGQPAPATEGYVQRIKTLEYIIQKMTESEMAHKDGVGQNTSASLDTPLASSVNESGYFHAPNFSSRLMPREPDKESVRAPFTVKAPAETRGRQLSARTIRDLEKHYRKGIGIRVGPAIEISRGFYDTGNSRADLVFGVLGDFIVSPSLSFETGAKYAHRTYEITNGAELSGMQLPGVDPSLGPLAAADVDSWMAEFPINLKYCYPLSMKTHLLAGIGYSSILYTKQVFEYYHELSSDPSAQINTSHKIEQFTLYPGMLNFSLGVSKELKHKKILETSLYYQHGLSKLGAENAQANFLGVRGTYWFMLK